MISAENVYNHLYGKVTGFELFSLNPIENATPTGPYAYINIVSNTPKLYSNKGHLCNTARVSFHIVCGSSLGPTETPERQLYGIIWQISNNLLSRGEMKRIDNVVCTSIVADSQSPIFNQNNRHYIVVDYLINY